MKLLLKGRISLGRKPLEGTWAGEGCQKASNDFGRAHCAASAGVLKWLCGSQTCAALSTADGTWAHQLTPTAVFLQELCSQYFHSICISQKSTDLGHHGCLDRPFCFWSLWCCRQAAMGSMWHRHFPKHLPNVYGMVRAVLKDGLWAEMISPK